MLFLNDFWRDMIDKNNLLRYIDSKLTIGEVMTLCKCSKNTVVNALKRHDIPTPTGFFSTGKKVGRPVGTPMTDEQKKVLSDKASGERNPMYGKVHTKEAKVKMSENHADVSGDKNPFKLSLSDPAKLKAHKERCAAVWEGRDIQYRKDFGRRISKSLSESAATKNIKFHRKHRSGELATDKGGEVFYRSSWEEFVAKQLDSNELVASFDIEPFAIPYSNIDGNERFVKVDFYVLLTNGEEVLLEVKPAKLCGYKNNPYKIAGYREYCFVNDVQFGLITDGYINEEVFTSFIREAYEGTLYVRGGGDDE